MKWASPSEQSWFGVVAAIVLFVSAPIWGPMVALLVAVCWLDVQKRRWIGPRREWSRWFAWHPVAMDHGFGDTVWLEWVERSDWYGRTIYREIGPLGPEAQL